MKYLAVLFYLALALLAALALTHSFTFIGPFTRWPLVLTLVAALVLVFVNRGRLFVSCGLALVCAALLMGVGAFFTCICLIFRLVGSQEAWGSAVDLLLLVGMGVLSLGVGGVTLGWGMARGLTSPRG